MEYASKILVTGGAGFIGHHLVSFLLKSTDATIFIVDNIDSGKKEYIPNSPRVILFIESILDESAIDIIFKKVRPDVVYHLAAKCFIPYCQLNPKQTMDVNMLGTEIIIKKCNEYKVQHLMFASTCAVYGISPHPLSEDHPTDPLEVYALSKLYAENLVKEKSVIPWTILRFFNVYGPDVTQAYLIPTIFQQLQKGHEVKIGNMDNARDYVYVTDLVRALCLCTLNRKTFSNVFNVGYGVSYSAREIISYIQSIFNIQITVLPDVTKVRQNDNPYISANISKIKTIVGWVPEISIKQGLQGVGETYNLTQ